MAKNKTAPTTAPTTAPATAPVNNTPYTPTEADISLMGEIDKAAASGNFRHVSQAEAGKLVAAGLVIVNTAMLNGNGNAAAQLSENGKKALPVETNTNTTDTNTGTSAGALAAASPAVAAPVSFAIATVEPPAIKRTPPKGGGQKPKYPQLDTLEIGQALFIPAAPGADTKKLSKTMGSMMADRNTRDKDKYFTSRGIPDGKEAGFVGVNEDGTPNPDAFAGVAGTALYRRPLEERRTRAPRKSKNATTNDTTGQADNTAPEGSGTADGTVGTAPGTPAGVPPANTADQIVNT